MSKQKTFGRSRPSVAYELQYRNALNEIIAEMQDETRQALKDYTASNALARDAKTLSIRDVMKALRERWYKLWEQRGRKLAKWLASKTAKRTEAQIKRKLKLYGFTVTPKYTAEQDQRIKEMVKENVALIKTIPQTYFNRIQHAAVEEFKRGQDVGAMTEVLEEILRRENDQTRNRAQLIARDQNQKITQRYAVETAKAVGAKKGRWIHVPGKFSSRITHIAMNKQVFDLNEGMYDEEVGRYIMPGELYYCNCQFEVLMPGFDE